VGPDRGYLGDLQYVNSDLQRELGNLKKELELTNQKLGSSMHSIKTFWSPELKKERALRKEESAKYSLINDQLKLLNSENQKQAMLVRQLEEELRMRMRQPSLEVQQQIETLYAENEHLTREIAILRDTIKVSRAIGHLARDIKANDGLFMQQELELRLETQKQTLIARDESIKKLLEMLQNKGMGEWHDRHSFALGFGAAEINAQFTCRTSATAVTLWQSYSRSTPIFSLSSFLITIHSASL
jgi:golgin subfamily B member 1